MARAKQERKFRTMSIADAVSEAFGDLVMLGEELREWADNIEEKFGSTDKYSRINDAASTLESLSEPSDAPEWANNTQIEIADLPQRRRGYSRADRCSQACYILDEAIQACDARMDDLKDDDSAASECDAIESFRDDLEQLKDEAEGVEFPGMYG